MNRPLLNRALCWLGSSQYRGLKGRRPAAKRRRRLQFESCESRQLLAATITGIKFATATATGFTPGSDLPMSGVTINLYQDNGDKIFDPATDALSQQTVTAANGSYAFNNVADGHYYIQESVPAGFTQSAGPPFYTVDVIGGLVYSISPAANPEMTQDIDSFSFPDPADTFFISALNPNPFTKSYDDASIIGGERDLTVNVLGAPNPISANGFVGTISMANGVFNLGSATNGPGTEVTLNYDGTTSTPMSADLTSGGGTGIELHFDFLQVGTGTTMDMEIAAASSGGTANFTGLITQDPTGFDLVVPYSQFTTTGAFDFTKVTSLQLSFNAAGVQDVDYQINQIDAAGFNFGNFAVSKRLFLTPATPVTSSFGGATFSFDSITGRMNVDGTTGNDAISIAPNNKGIAIVTVNGHVLANTIPLASIQQIGISGGDGSDTVTLTNIVKPVLFDGGAGTDHLIVNGAAANNSFVVSGTQLFFNGALYNLGNVEGLTLNGQAKADTLLVQTAPAFPTVFNGGGGSNDAVIGPNTTNNWNITAAGGGTLNSSLSFSAVENIFGGSGNDTFNFSAGQKIAGLVDGGAGSDTLTYGTYNKAVAINLQTKKATLIGGFANLESFIGGTAANTLTAANQTNTWAIAGTNSGAVGGIAFANFQNLTGGTKNDTFVFADASVVTGKINGGTGFDSLDYTAYTTTIHVHLPNGPVTNILGGILSIDSIFGPTVVFV